MPRRPLALLALLCAATPLLAQGGIKRTSPWLDLAGGIWYHREPLLPGEQAIDRTGQGGIVRLGRRQNPGASAHYVLSVQSARTGDATRSTTGTPVTLGYDQLTITGGVESDSDVGPVRVGLGIEFGWGRYRERARGGGTLPDGIDVSNQSNIVLVPTITVRDRFNAPVGVVAMARFTQITNGFGFGG
nr:hypothetical protein [Gemmatimonadaceae bacterium]